MQDPLVFVYDASQLITHLTEICRHYQKQNTDLLLTQPQQRKLYAKLTPFKALRV